MLFILLAMNFPLSGEFSNGYQSPDGVNWVNKSSCLGEFEIPQDFFIKQVLKDGSIKIYT